MSLPIHTADNFKKRRVLYTGGAGGLGLPAVMALLEQGATVVVLDHDEAKIAELKKLAVPWQGKLHIHQVDLGDQETLENTLSRVIGDVGGIDTLINNAAIYPSKPFEDYSLEEYKLIQKINVESAVICTQKVLPHMKEMHFGRIVNVTSITLSGGWEKLSPYVASKGTLLGLARTWAREFGQYGITVNCLAPGAFPTDAEKIHPDLEGYTKTIFEHQAIKRRGTPEDIVNALLFFISNSTSFVTGQTLNVDGGWVMQ
jgi:NAD(P)-dependent dehydrogenase (short-subunit alcohol dehydrogenase family)